MGHRVTTLNVNTIEPAGATLTIGADGDSVVIGNNDIRANTYKDAGGNTLFTSNGSGGLSSVNSGFSDSLKLLSTQTASNSASLSFTSGIDATYKEYIFKFIDINPATNGGALQFQVNVAGQSGYNETMTTSYFQANHHEDNDPAELGYASGDDQAQGTSFQSIISYISNAGDGCGVGELHLFNPASTTYVKNWNSVGQCMGAAPGSLISYGAGYINVTAAVDEIQFKMNSGNFDGTIKMYGYT